MFDPFTERDHSVCEDEDTSLRDVGTLGRLLKEKWDQIAPDYYGNLHPTTRNFDAVIGCYLPYYLELVSKQGLFLDLGGGCGRLPEYLCSPQAKIVVGDISLPMLKTGRAARQGISYIQLSAFQLPFRDEVFDAVVSILGDSYALPEAFQEIHRILKSTGIFIIALPSKLWASVLRPKIGLPADETVLTSSSYGAIRVPSVLYSEAELQNCLLNTHFEDVQVRSFASKGVIEESTLSPHILTASSDFNASPLDLPIVTIALARKG